MIQVDLRSLVGRLNDTARQSLEGAAGLCLSRTHYDVEVEHWLVKLLEHQDSDLIQVLRHYDVDLARLATDLGRALDGFKTGNARPPALSPRIIDLAREAWVLASLEMGAGRVGSGHLLMALVSDDSLSRLAGSISSQFEKVPAAELRKQFQSLVADSPESRQTGVPPGGHPTAAEPGRPGAGGRTPALDQYTTNLTERARRGEIDPVLGRDMETRQIADILTRRRQNNPIMTGEAGVGKTAVVEGFALRVVAGDVPPPLRGVEIHTLDLGLLQAGAGVKGEFDNRLRSVIDEVKNSPVPIILFIDEAHTLIGAGGAAGQQDAANLLKPALARGELRTIAATTWSEYKKYFEKDPALTRRFQVVKVEEPGEQSAIEMMRGLVSVLEGHHKVRVLDEGVSEAVRLSHRYISDRQLPDKSVSVLDTACARVALSQSATPAPIEDCQRRLEQIAVERRILEREASTGADHQARLGALDAEEKSVQERLEALEAQLASEKALAKKVWDLRARLEGEAAPVEAAAEPEAGKAEGGGKQPAEAAAEAGEAEASAAEAPKPLTDQERAKLSAELAKVDTELAKVQGEQPLMHVCVNGQAVAEVIGNWTGIPVGRMMGDQVRRVLDLDGFLGERVVGQDHALHAIGQRVRISRAKLEDPNKPIGVFLMVGTSGVGKTETALALAEALYGGEQNVTTLNMSEFKEEHKVALLMGSPPGYVGYGEGGVLTEAVRRKPYSIVLLDEMEKAHPGVQDIFYQVFDKGMMKDGEGRDIDFKNTIVIMTSNAGTDTIMKLCADPETAPDAEGLLEGLHDDLLKYFKPAFLGRCTVVPYFPLAPDVLKRIIRLKLGKVARRLKENYNADFELSDALVDAVAGRCHDPDSGARNIDNVINGGLLPMISAELLGRIAEGKGADRVGVTVEDGGRLAVTVS
jgi:type VI secretion system protein VasG